MTPLQYELSHLQALEAESIHIFREVAAELERPVLLFSGGKDSIVLLRLAEKAFRPGALSVSDHARRHRSQLPRGHRVPRSAGRELGERLIVANVQDSIDRGRVVEETGPRASRNRLQTTTLLDAIEEHGFDAAFGGARRDEERARAKERVFSFRDDFGQWDPKRQRPELWSLYNGRIRKGEHVRVFPISNWTELDVWQYIGEEKLEVPSIYFSHPRQVFRRDGMLYAHSAFVELIDGEAPFQESVRYRTVGDMTCTGAVRSRRDDARGRGHRDRRHADHRARRDARRRPCHRGGDGGSQARGLLLSGERRHTMTSIPALPPTATPRSTDATSELLRIATAGSVDDGKSTLIGRLLLRLQGDPRGPARARQETSERRGDGYLNLALLTDGLRAEREQGITIDVAYRYF